MAKATSLKDVQLSMQGEESPAPSYVPTPEYGSGPQHQYLVFRLVDTSRKGDLYLNGVDEAKNPKTGRMERIYLIPGAASIWQSDLIDSIKDEKDILNKVKSLEFKGGVLRVLADDTLTLEWIRACRHLIDNPSRRSGSKFEFFEHNPAKAAQAAMKKELLELEMVMKAKDMEIDEVKKLAAFLGIVFFDELGGLKTDEGIRTELMLAAKRDPYRFQKYAGSREVTISYLVKRAILDARIDLGSTQGSAVWAGGGGIICRIPQGRGAQDYLVELALTNSDEGRTFVEQLSREVK
jgi:hypothetical protein